MIVIVLLLLGNAFFVAAEFALIAARRSEIEAQKKSFLQKETLRAMDQVSLMMATAQIGITACTIGLGATAKPAVAYFLKDVFQWVLPSGVALLLSTGLALLLVAALHVVFSEMIPKNIALAKPSASAKVLAFPLRVLSFVAWPVVWSLSLLANAILRLFGIEPRDALLSAFTGDEVASLIEESHRDGQLERAEKSLAASALQFEKRDIKQVLRPLDQWEKVDADTVPRDLELLAARTGFSRFPVVVYGELRGYLHLKDALLSENIWQPFPSSSWRSLPLIQEEDSLLTALETMQRYGAHLGRVENKKGELLGIVALEDVLEELIGEVRDVAGRIVRVK